MSSPIRGRECVWLTRVNTLAEKLNVAPPQLRNTGAPVQHALRQVNGLLADMPKHGMVCAIHLMRDPWKFQDGLLTPTFKIKRKVVEDSFHDEIAALYTPLGQSTQRKPSAERGTSTDI